MITINGKTYEGTNISVINDQVIIDGKVVEGDESGRVVRVEVKGHLASLSTDRSASCENVAGNVSAKGSVNCADVGGSVDAGGSVNCSDVKGAVRAGGSVNCDEAGGNVSAGGSVRHR